VLSDLLPHPPGFSRQSLSISRLVQRFATAYTWPAIVGLREPLQTVTIWTHYDGAGVFRFPVASPSPAGVLSFHSRWLHEPRICLPRKQRGSDHELTSLTRLRAGFHLTRDRTPLGYDLVVFGHVTPAATVSTISSILFVVNSFFSIPLQRFAPTQAPADASDAFRPRTLHRSRCMAAPRTAY